LKVAVQALLINTLEAVFKRNSIILLYLMN